MRAPTPSPESARPQPVDDAREAAASSLCVACGICCEGVLHRKATLDAEDVEPARRLGLRLEPRAEPAALRLPCPRFQGCCTVYADRPQVCRRYACRLLERTQAGEVEQGAALERIAVARERLDAVRALLPRDSEAMGPWRQIEALAAADGVSPESEAFLRGHAELVFVLARLGQWLDLHFRPEPDETPT